MGALLLLAAVVLDLTTEELVARSDVVVHGTVLDLRAEKSPDGAQIFTRVRVRVDDALKGKPGAVVTVLVPGGEVGDIAQLVPGAPRFEAGEEVVLMLHRRGKSGDTYGVQALGRGKYHVKQTERGKLAVPQTEGLELVRETPGGQLVPSPRAEGPQPLTVLKERVRQAAVERKP